MTLFAKIQEGPDDQVALREYLRARLFDVFISDFDRHRKQWRWMRQPGDALWHPIPEDRDQAFARYDGFIVRLVARLVPQVRDFGGKYDRIFGLTYNGREQDRWLLVGLPREAWHAEAQALQAAFTDEVIERAARRMPDEWYKIDGARLVAALKQRRVDLAKEADVFYEFLAHQVDVQATNANELTRVKRQTDGGVEIQVARLGAGGAPEAPYFDRLFKKGETDDIRVYLRGGDDKIEVEGPSGGIKVRVIGGKGNDLLDDAKTGGTKFYDSLGDNKVVEGSGTSWDKRPYSAPPGPEGAPWIPPRDWGRDHFWVPWLSYGTDEGVFLGGGITTVGYGFRKHPWADQQTLRAGWAFGAQQPKVDYRGEFREGRFGLPLRAACVLLGPRDPALLRLRQRDRERRGRRVLQAEPAPDGVRAEPDVAARRVARPDGRARAAVRADPGPGQPRDPGEPLRHRRLRPDRGLGAASGSTRDAA